MDAAGIRLNCGNAEQREIGKGGIDFAPMLAAAKNRSKYYFMERDPVAVGGPTNFNPFTNTENSMKAMRADPAPTLYAAAPVFPLGPAGTVAAAANAVPVVVTNDGDAPLTITNITVAADASTAATPPRPTSRSSARTASAPATSARWRRASSPWPTIPATPDVNEASPAVPSGTCTVNVGFKPTRTNYTSVARLQFTSNSDDAVERVLLAGQEHRRRAQHRRRRRPEHARARASRAQPGSFGTFAPTVTRSYETARRRRSSPRTAGDATLSVVDPSTGHPGPPGQHGRRRSRCRRR